MVECVFQGFKCRPIGYKPYMVSAIDNVEGVIDLAAIYHIEGKPLFSLYTSRNFMGFVWKDAGIWHIEVMKEINEERTTVAVISSPDILAVVRTVRNIFGVE